MNEQHIGRSVRRLEDSRFLVGRGRYVVCVSADHGGMQGTTDHTT